MAKATLTLKNGTQVTIEGLADEVATLLGTFNNGEPTTRRKRAKASSSRSRTSKSGLSDQVSDLVGSGFFKQPRELGEVKSALAERGHHYPRTTLSPLLLRFVRQKELRRMKEGERWVYVN